MLPDRENVSDIARIQALAAKDAWVDWLTGCIWHLFVTLTFDRERMPFRMHDSKVVRQRLFAWRRRLERTLRHRLFFVFTVEWIGDWPHLHGLVMVGGDLFLDPDAMRKEWWRSGGLANVQIVQPGSVAGVASYMFKSWDQPGFDVFTTRRLS